MFQWEIVEIMRQCRQELVEAHPWIEPYVKISCEKTGPAWVGVRREDGSPILEADGSPLAVQVEHHCTFQGWEDVEEQCDFPWALHEARTFQPKHHAIRKPGG